MDLSQLTQHKEILDVRSNKKTVFVLTTTNTQPPIYTDKELIYIPIDQLLTHPRLTEVLSAKDVDNNAAYKQYLLYTYKLTHLTPTKKQSFAHKLQGTGGRTSLIKQLQGKKIGRSAVQIPANNQNQFEEFLSENNVTYQKQEMLLTQTS